VFGLTAAKYRSGEREGAYFSPGGLPPWRLAPRPAGLFFSPMAAAHKRRQLFAKAAIASSRVAAYSGR
jgi:hypothetical protein